MCCCSNFCGILFCAGGEKIGGRSGAAIAFGESADSTADCSHAPFRSIFPQTFAVLPAPVPRTPSHAAPPPPPVPRCVLLPWLCGSPGRRRCTLEPIRRSSTGAVRIPAGIPLCAGVCPVLQQRRRTLVRDRRGLHDLLNLRPGYAVRRRTSSRLPRAQWWP